MHKVISFIECHEKSISLILTASLFVIGFLIERKARRIQTAVTWKEFRDPIIDYANEVIFTLSQACELCHTDHFRFGKDDFWKKYTALLTKLTSLIDQGRLRIPNLMLEDDSAYGGRRKKPLDCLVGGYKISKAINYNHCAFNKDKTNDPEDKQYLQIREGLNKLDQDEIRKIEKDKDFSGWSCNSALVEVKRQFVHEISVLIQARQWANDINELIEKKT